jgi:membrane-associated protein
LDGAAGRPFVSRVFFSLPACTESIENKGHMMEYLQIPFTLLKHLTDPELLRVWVEQMGPWLYLLLFGVVFCETGLVITPFLPGDSLLFAVGAVTASTHLSLPLVFVALSGAAILGDAVNYYIGYRIGPKVFTSEKSRLFNRKHLLRTQQFYEQYGGKTIILARFIPIIRTFAPFVAGIGKMGYPRFALYNVVGGVAWVLLCLLAGYYFGSIAWVQRNFESVLVAIVLISVLPMVIEFFLARRRAANSVQRSAISDQRSAFSNCPGRPSSPKERSASRTDIASS